MMTIRVLLADDHPVVLGGLTAMLSRHRDIDVIATARDGYQAIELYEAHRPDVVLLDIRMPLMTGIETLVRIRAKNADARIVMVTTYDDEESIYQSLRGGARGYVSKSASGEEIADAIRRVHDGQRYIPALVSEKIADHIEQSPLTGRELDVLALAARGNRNKEIARCLGITEGTVKGYMTVILTKLAARDRTEAVTIAVRRGLINIE